MSEPYLRMVNIQKSFPGVQALKGVDFEAYAGEALALIGANGAGKTPKVSNRTAQSVNLGIRDSNVGRTLKG